jgi:hypothetical protein
MSFVVSDAKVDAIASLLHLFERATINMDESLFKSIQSVFAICLKFVDKQSLHKSLVDGFFIDWEYVSNAGGMGIVAAAAAPPAGKSSGGDCEQQQQQIVSSRKPRPANFSVISTLACMGAAAAGILLTILTFLFRHEISDK